MKDSQTEQELVFQFLAQCLEVESTFEKLQEISKDYANGSDPKVVGHYDLLVLRKYRERFETHMIDDYKGE